MPTSATIRWTSRLGFRPRTRVQSAAGSDLGHRAAPAAQSGSSVLTPGSSRIPTWAGLASLIAVVTLMPVVPAGAASARAVTSSTSTASTAHRGMDSVMAAPGRTANTVAQVNSKLKRAEANLSSVDGSIGRRTSPPKGSAAKLARSRLDQAATDLVAAKAILDGLPAGGAGVSDAATRYNAAVAVHTRLMGILSGGAGTPVKPEDPNAVKLNYQQEDILKSARFNMREVDAGSRALTQLMGELVSIPDQLAIDHRRVAAGLATAENARRKAGFVADALEQLPANGRGVSAVAEQLNAAAEAIDGSSKYLNDLAGKLQAIIDPAAYPEGEADFRRLQNLAGMYRDPGILDSQRERAAEAIEQSEAARAEVIRIAGRYQRVMQQKTDLGVRIENAGNWFLQAHAEFMTAAAEAGKRLPEQIRSHLTEAAGYADTAVAEQKPLWFSGGIPQQLGFAEEKIQLLRRIDPASGDAMAGELAAARTVLKRQADSLSALIIRENKLPRDLYTGDDRDRIIAVAIDAWMVQQPTFELLAVRMPIETWAREQKMTYSSGSWVYSDRSRLQMRLLVADPKQPDQMIDRPITVWMDHERGDSMIGTPLWSIKEPVQPQWRLRRELATPELRATAAKAYEAAVKARAARG
ncbi:MAG: hypothetical protein AB8G96_04705 [Phycisphaerales bacterium]